MHTLHAHTLQKYALAHLRVEPKGGLKLLARVGGNLDVHAGLDVLELGQVDGVLLVSGQPEGICILPRLEAQWDDAHAHKVAAVDALK